MKIGEGVMAGRREVGKIVVVGGQISVLGSNLLKTENKGKYIAF